MKGHVHVAPCVCDRSRCHGYVVLHFSGNGSWRSGSHHADKAAAQAEATAIRTRMRRSAAERKAEKKGSARCSA